MMHTLPLQTAPPLDPQALPTGRFDAIYVHVPFCFHKCHYCDFYSITRQSPERMERYVDLVLAEAELWAQGPAMPAVRAQTIFFGGGTPSLLPFEQMERLLRGLAERFDLADVTEWTLEANPATVEADYCAMLRTHGVNRLSFGAQSFDRIELAALERHHDPEDVPRSVEIARLAGFERLNVDLIYAIPGQSFESWMASLERAIALGTAHLSCYGLTYEPNTPMAVRKRLGQFQAAAEELELRMMHATRQRLAAVGMEAYEISNYAKPGQECRHNLLYWNGGNYLGLGPAAASHLAGTRWRNRPHLGEWETAVGDGRLPATDVEILLHAQRAGELIMLQLRLKGGVKFAEFAGQTGCDARGVYAAQIEHLAKLGLVIVDDDALRLTETGLNVADAVAAEFLHV